MADRPLCFAKETEDSWALWAFAKSDPGKVIAALELLATLVGVRVWGHGQPVERGPATEGYVLVNQGWTHPCIVGEMPFE